MKCINKSAISGLCLVLTLSLCGCGSSSLKMPYDPDTSVGAYILGSESNGASIDGFASSLCVADADIMPDASLLLTAEAGALFDINDKETVICKNVNKRMNPASLTKVMTALVAVSYGHLEDVYTASPNVAIAEKGVQLMGLREGDRMTLDQALHGLLMYSANDCGVLIAENIAGSVDSFAELMNKKAQELGATNTNFKNPHGLTDEEHYTTVYDLYLIFNEAIKDERILKILNETEYSTTYKDRDGNSKNFECQTTNGYLNGKFTPPSGVTVLGGKTGTTSAAGSCLIILSNDAGNNPYISVVLNDLDHESVYKDMTGLLNNIH